MTTAEFRDILHKMTDAEFDAFRKQFGGEGERESYVDQFVRNADKFEPIICRLLNVPTEKERLTKATLLATDAAILSEQHARTANDHANDANRIAIAANKHAYRSNRLSMISIGVSVVAIIVSIVAICVSFRKP